MPALDWLRFAAAMQVLLYHLRGSCFAAYGDLSLESQGWITRCAFAATRLGPEAVVLFFVLSGFLVGGRGIERLLGGKFRLRDYAIDRVTRIYVPYLPALFLTAAIGSSLGQPMGWMDWIAGVLSLQEVLCPAPIANQATWSLAYEMWFYLLLGAVAAVSMGKRDKTRVVGCGVIALCAIVFSVLQIPWLFSWLAGALAYLMRGRCKGFIPLAIGSVLIVLGLIASQLMANTGVLTLGSLTFPIHSRQIWMMLMGFGMALWLPLLSRSTFSQGRRIGAALAAFSYSLYLVHTPIILWMNHGRPRSTEINLSTLGEAISVIAVCLAAAWLSYLCFERHTPQVRRWLSGRQGRH
jgi:peptidoglycan/LPS O-acetylase OafA/YrhL